MLRGLIVVLLILGGPGCSQRTAQEPVLLGMVQPLSGPERNQGQAAQQASRLALAELLTEEVRVAGREFTVLHGDAGDSLKTVRAETVRLLAVNRTPTVVGVLNPALGEAFLREARLLSAPAILAGELAIPPSGEGLLTLGAGPEARAQAMVQFIREDLKVTPLGVIVDERNPVAVNLATALTRSLRTAPSLPCPEFRFDSNESLGVALKEVVATEPKVIVLALPGTDQPLIRQRLSDLGYSGMTFDAGADEDHSVSQTPSDAAHYRVTVYAGTDLTATGQTFVKTYRERFGVDPTISAALTWEAVRLLGETLSKNGSTSSLRLREAFGKDLKYEGITGSVTFQNGQAVRKLFLVKELQGKQSTERVFSRGE